MKNALIYYYNLNPNDIHQTKEMYKFNINNNYYTLLEIKEDIKKIEEIYNLSNYLNKNGIYTHQIILNMQNNVVTIINNKNFVLLKTYNKMDRKINLNDIINFVNITIGINYKNNYNNWYNKWINKVDYFEYEINELENKYPLIKKSFKYFSGLTETGIQLLINLNIKEDKLCVCHERIKKNYTLFDFYNPFNFIIDSSVRDIVEYLKNLYLDDNNYNEIEKYINNTNLSNDQLKLFFVRMIYPSFYYDKCEEIMIGKESEKSIMNIVNKIDDYENLLKKTYTQIKSICWLPEISWLE